MTLLEIIGGLVGLGTVMGFVLAIAKTIKANGKDTEVTRKIAQGKVNHQFEICNEKFKYIHEKQDETLLQIHDIKKELKEQTDKISTDTSDILKIIASKGIVLKPNQRKEPRFDIDNP
jgi:hypothetical protein